MAVASIEDLRSALADGAYDRVLDTPESSWIDFKGQAYALGTDRGNWELCKDVAAFANASGGCILLGVATTKPDASSAERASELKAMPAALANRERHRDIISVGVYPVPAGIEVCTYVDPGGGCYLAIWVPAQNDGARPVLVRYLLEDGGRRVHGFGWPLRVDDAVVWQSCEQFQTRLSLSGLLQAFNLQRTQSQVVDVNSLTRHLRLLEATDGDGPSLASCLVPRERMDLTPVMYGDDTSITAAVRRRKPLRPSGFHITPSLTRDLRGSNGIEWGSRWRTAIDFDGTLMMTARVNDHALAWNMADRKRPNLINAIFLVELVNEFMRAFYEAVVPLSGRTHQCWSGTLIAAEMARGKTQLMSGWSDYIRDEPHVANSDDYRRSFELTGEANRDTFEALVRFYALFGFGPEDVPFCADRAFSPDVFRQQTRR